MKKIIVFNWKMNPEKEIEAQRLAQVVEKSKTSQFEVIICPPFVYLESLIKKFKNLKFGAQNCFWEEKGAFTGEISPKMLKNLKVKFVILGHSERRKYLKENEIEIGKKLKAAVKNKLIPIFCLGESLKEREKNLTKKVLKRQLLSLKEIKEIKKPKLLIAYEPVWAIGTGKTCPPEEAVKVILYLKKILNSFFKSKPSLAFLYGGSVNSKNIKEFLKQKEIDGVLVGGASLKEKEISLMLSK